MFNDLLDDPYYNCHLLMAKVPSSLSANSKYNVVLANTVISMKIFNA
jgi:hypothetical protein